MSFFPPLVSFDRIELADANRCLTKWGHRMGPLNRPTGGGWVHALFHDGEPVGLAAADILMKSRVAGLDRDQALELARLCACRRDLNRIVLRLWREFVFPALGYPWVVSYQDSTMHTGDLYRFDGWVPLDYSRSGTDQRSGAKGRNKIVWGWCADTDQRVARRTEYGARRAA